MTNEVVIVSATRTAIGKFGGSLATISAIELGKTVATSAIQKANLTPEQIDYTIFGNVLQAGLGQNPARQIAIGAGIPVTSPAMTVNEVCGSGLKAIIAAVQAIKLGDARIVLAGGVESMSTAPHYSYNRIPVKAGNVTLVDSIFKDGLTDAFSGEAMGITAETVAKNYSITREEQDLFALASQQKAAKAQQENKFAEEITPVEIKGKRGAASTWFTTDEYPRSTTLEALATLKPAFKQDGTVTAGNASGINDGAAAVIVTSKQIATELQLPILATISGYAEAGIEPEIMGCGPIPAIKQLVAKTNTDLATVDLFELNEAFASQSIAVIKELGISKEKVNVNGGAIALGHPIGASGIRIVVTLLHELNRQQLTTGIASLCVGGGIGVALQIKR